MNILDYVNLFSSIDFILALIVPCEISRFSISIVVFFRLICLSFITRIKNIITQIVNIHRFILNSIVKAPFSALFLRNEFFFPFFYCLFVKFIIEFNRGLNKFIQ